MTQTPPRITIKDFPGLHAEVNRLRREHGLEPVGGLGFAQKLVNHFRVESNPRVAEAIRRYEEKANGSAV